MSIAVVCRNGHALKVKECCAGKTGRCPICHVLVEVPDPEATKLSDDDILDILGPHVPDAEKESKRPGRPSLLEQLESATARTKLCEKCNTEIDASSRICPNCRTYIPDWGGS